MNTQKNIITLSLSFATAIILASCSGGSSDSSGSSGDVGSTDTTKPVITLSGSSVLYQQRGLPYVDPGATAQDDTDGDISNSVQMANSVNSDVVGIYTVTYTVSDSASNAAVPATRTVHVVYSTVKQTGQNTSYDASGTVSTAIRDDGHYQTGVISDYQHNPDGTVTDRVTGLMWQDDTVVQKNFDEAGTYCSDLSLGGYGDWRMPSIRELMNIVAHGADTTPDTFQTWNTNTNYWSATTLNADSSQAWGASITTATDSVMTKSQYKNVRCVRGTSPMAETKTRNDTDKVVFDPNTGLEWEDGDTINSHTWEEALSYCRTLGDGWQLPNYNELYMLLNRTQSDPLDSVFQTRPASNAWFWTSTTYDGDHTNALEIKLSQGDDKWYAKTASTNIKCVRTRGLDLATAALLKVTQYAATNGGSTAPTLSDYDDAGITGITSSNLDAINQQVAAASESDVDSVVEVQDLVNNFITANIPIPILDISAVSGTSGYLKATLSNVDTANLSRVRIYRNSSDDIAGKVKVFDATSLASTMNYTGDTTLASCHTYYYWVEACTDLSGTELCKIDTTSQSDKTVPAAPTGLKAYATVIRSLNMQWDNNNDSECTVKYHLFQRTTETGPFTLIPEINDLTSGTDGATATNVNTGVYIHYRVQAEDAQGRKSSLSCDVARDYPLYGVNSAQDSCRAAVGYTWGDQPHYPWASYDGYTNKVVFTWDDVPLVLNTDKTVQTYTNYYSIRFKVGSGSWSGYYDVTNQNFTYNGAQYQQVTVPDDIPDISTIPSNTTVEMEVSTVYMYDNDGDGTPETTYSAPIYITGKTAVSTTSTSSLGIPPATTATTFYPDFIMVGWTPTSGADHYKLYRVNTTGTCPSSGYEWIKTTTSTTFYDYVTWAERCYRASACDINDQCTPLGKAAYGNSSGW